MPFRNYAEAGSVPYDTHPRTYTPNSYLLIFQELSDHVGVPTIGISGFCISPGTSYVLKEIHMDLLP